MEQHSVIFVLLLREYHLKISDDFPTFEGAKTSNHAGKIPHIYSTP